MVANFNLTWKTACMEILNYFTERTPGSYIEEREATIVWRFWCGRAEDAADRQWALRQAAEAQNHIFDRWAALSNNFSGSFIQSSVLANATVFESFQE
jgi:trehalose-6-phosphatase